MARPRLEVADIFRAHGPAWRKANAGHVSLGQLKVMSAIENCRTAALGGHVERCEDCAHERVAYNSCRNRHCPKCQGAAARQWLAEREAELLPVPYYHVVFTLPAAIGALAFANKAVVYDLLFKKAAETLITIAADPKHLGARIGLTAVLHTWGSALTHHPHLHVIVPGGGLSPDGSCWIARKPGFFLPVRVLSRLFRRLFLEGLKALKEAGKLAFFGDIAPLADKDAFDAALAPLRRSEWVVYAKRPFAGPQAVLAYLARYTHRVAISNSRLVAFDEAGVAFAWKDYRIRGRDRFKTMTLDAAEFIRRFLMHVLPTGFHRIRHYGLFASAVRAQNVERARQLLATTAATPEHSCAKADNGDESPCGRSSMSMLRRPDDRHRNLRRRAPWHVRRRRAGSGSTPHERWRRAHPLATPIALEAGQPPELPGPARSRPADPRQAPNSHCALTPPPQANPTHLVQTDEITRLQPSQQYPRSTQDLQIPIGRARPDRASSGPRFPPREAFERRPRGGAPGRVGGRRPKPFTIAVVGEDSRLVGCNRDALTVESI